ncbi:beta-1,3-galactosyltransferase 5-like [Haliotis cracherodii]|uniref:beta-1,3-galactosyltransferase 5-like n=1 Tax=Haliotis cracherodii TaxID=6455 RepID=UPI0039E74E2C
MMSRFKWCVTATLLVVTALIWIQNIHVLKQHGDNHRLSHPWHLPSWRPRTRTQYPATNSIKYTLNNPNICRNTETVSLLFIVSSSTTHAKSRQYIRDTFANHTYFRFHVIRLIFIVGKSQKESIERELIAENREYGDVIQGDFLDSYRNLTLKVVAEFHWVAKHCPNVTVVAKIDDDAFVDTVKFLRSYFPVFRTGRRYILCNFIPRMLIDRAGRWIISNKEHVLKHYDAFPWSYCSGYGVFFSGNMIAQLYKAATTSPFLWVDDVYFSGVLPSRLTDIKYKHLENRWNGQVNNTQCFLRYNCHDIFGVVDKEDLYQIWNYTIKTRYRQYIF